MGFLESGRRRRRGGCGRDRASPRMQICATARVFQPVSAASRRRSPAMIARTAGFSPVSTNSECESGADG